MKLFLNKTSPYARMVRILILERGLEERVELCWCDPWSDDQQLLSVNPAGKVPVLVSDTGVSISESLLIAIYLCGLGPVTSLLPDNNKEAVLHLAGLGQGVMEAAFAVVISRKYLNEEANESVLAQRRKRAIERTLERLEQGIDRYSTPEITMGDIAVAVALDYLLFRLSDLDTRSKFPKLEAWRTSITQRPSFKNTTFD